MRRDSPGTFERGDGMTFFGIEERRKMLIWAVRGEGKGAPRRVRLGEMLVTSLLSAGCNWKGLPDFERTNGIPRAVLESVR